MKQMKNSIKKYKKVKLLMPIQSLRSPASRPRVWKEPPVASSLGCPQPHQKSEALVHEIGPLQTKCFMKSAGQILWVVLVVCGLGAVRVEGLRRIVCVQDLFQQLPVWHALHLRILLHLCRVHLWMLCVWLRTQIDGRGVLSNLLQEIEARIGLCRRRRRWHFLIRIHIHRVQVDCPHIQVPTCAKDSVGAGCPVCFCKVFLFP